MAPPPVPALSASVASFCCAVPKAELHVHVEGTLEPALLLSLAARNGLPAPHGSVRAAVAARDFTCLADFLALYYQGCAVLLTRHDFRDVLHAYLTRAHADGVAHAEVFFDPQSHTSRGVSWDAMLGGLADARKEAAAEHGMSSALVMCFLRHLGAEAAMETLDAVLSDATRRAAITGIGLDSNEIYDDPSPWAPVFAKAAAAGLRLCCHAGEEESAAYVAAVIATLHVERIDHGVRSLDDDSLVAQLAASQTPLTTCPISNLRLRVYGDTYAQHLAQLLRAGVCVTINSDDPAYFLALDGSGRGAYIGANYEYAAAVGGLDCAGVAALAKRSFHASFLPDEDKQRLLAAVDEALLLASCDAPAEAAPAC
jgi:adenosine deaminase